MNSLFSSNQKALLRIIAAFWHVMYTYVSNCNNNKWINVNHIFHEITAIKIWPGWLYSKFFCISLYIRLYSLEEKPFFCLSSDVSGTPNRIFGYQKSAKKWVWGKLNQGFSSFFAKFIKFRSTSVAVLHFEKSSKMAKKWRKASGSTHYLRPLPKPEKPWTGPILLRHITLTYLDQKQYFHSNLTHIFSSCKYHHIVLNWRIRMLNDWLVVQLEHKLWHLYSNHHKLHRHCHRNSCVFSSRFQRLEDLDSIDQICKNLKIL